MDETLAVLNFLNGKYVVKLLKPTKFRNLDTGETVILEEGDHKVYGNYVPKVTTPCLGIVIDLKYVFVNMNRRVWFSKCVRKALSYLHHDQEDAWSQNIEEVITIKDHIGSGSWGSVYNGHITNSPHMKVAIKYAKIKEEALKSKNFSSWNELKILKIFQKVIEKNCTQNLLYLIDDFTTNQSKFNNMTFKDNEQGEKSLVMIFELATCNLRSWLEKPKSVLELQSCLFQIMHALHTMQKFGQVHHFDIKPDNILCYKTKRGGYWKYTVLGKDYYVPNLGFVFVLADFGLSRSLSPEHVMLRNEKDATFRLGHRYAIVDSESKRFIPVDCTTQVNSNGTLIDAERVKWKNGYYSFGGESRSDRLGNVIKMKFQSKSIGRGVSRKCNYKNAMVFPPFEFYYDTQDVIRMFIGGKRNTQKGNHREFDLDVGFLSSLKKYKYEDNNEQLFPEEVHFVLAGYFIVDYFSCFEEKTDEVIGEYGF